MYKTLKILLISIDNRELSNDIKIQGTNPNGTHIGKAAVLVSTYAKKHGYDYLYFRPNSTDLAKQVSQLYGLPENETAIEQYPFLSTHVGWASASKVSGDSFNGQLKQFRSSPWSRLPILWYFAKYFLYKQIHSQAPVKAWDYIFYMDSDFFMDPTFFETSLDELIDYWSTVGPDSLHSLEWDQTVFKFFSNQPYNAFPCTGGFLLDMRQPELMSDLLLEWWNYNDMELNWVHAFEQEALHWLWIKLHRIRTYSTYLHEVLQFLPCGGHIFCHVNGPLANELLDQFLAKLGVTTEDQFRRLVDEIKEQSVCSAPLLPITEMMALEDPAAAMESYVNDKNSLINGCHTLMKLSES